MVGHDIVVVGASAGGVEALSSLAAALPEDLPAALFVVLHVPAHATSVLPQILSRLGKLPACHPRPGQPIESGHIYVAPPDTHLLVEPGRVNLTKGPRENGYRPAIDALFRSAARAYGARVVGVVLSGMLDDGTNGLAAIKARHGIAVVQDPADALYGGMSRSALESVEVDHVVPLLELAPLLARLARLSSAAVATLPAYELAIETQAAALEDESMGTADRPGTPSGFTCPECHGALWQLEEGNLVRFRCRVGHAYSGASLMAAEANALEAALWTALRTLEETSALHRQLAGRLERRGRHTAAERLQREAREAQQRALLVRQILRKGSDVDDTTGNVPDTNGV
jgi:two-component system chemotaxis response regulator CheB